MNPVPSTFESWPFRSGLIAVSALSLIAFYPSLFAGPGYESALLAGLFLPYATAIVTAIEVARRRLEALHSIALGLRIAAVFGTLCYAISLLHGLRAGLCDITGGSLHFLLGPWAGALLSGCFGALAGHLASLASTPRKQRALCISLAILPPLISIGISIYRFYTSPMVFAFDPFVGFFSGTLYDTVIEWTGLLSYRAGTLATLLSFLCVSALLHRDDSKRLRLTWIPRADLIAAGILCLCTSLWFMRQGPSFGHFQSSQNIAEALGAKIEGLHCTVLYPSSMPEDQARRFTRECDTHIEQGQRFFDAPISFKVTAYLFLDASQKAFLMGAANTYVAKPWRREIYVQQSGFPHPVLGHELMHVLAGAFARGPFRIAGSFGGILPDPGLIEGIAVAAAPREGDLTPAEWAKAMKDLGLLPRLQSLFALGFLGHNAALAYTVSGAFVQHIRAHHGASVVRAWYGGADLPELTRKPWNELEQDFHRELDALTLSQAALAQAKARFDKPAIFGRRCPHVVDGCKARAEAFRASGDFAKASAEYERAMGLDPGDFSLGLGLARTLIRRGKTDEARIKLNELSENEQMPAAFRDKASEELGDIALSSGDTKSAEQHYLKAQARLVDEDALRTLDIKLLAARHASVREAVVTLLIGRPGQLPDKFLAIDQLATWAAKEPNEGLPPYLLGRHYIGAAQFDEAAARLDKALSAKIEAARVRVEAKRLLIVAACAREDHESLRRGFEDFKMEPGVNASRREAVERFVERCSRPF